MSKEIKDYIHYFIGQKFTYGNGCPLYTLMGIMPYRSMHKNPADEFRLICIDADGQWDEMPLDEHFKLALRRLEDMAEEEMKEVFKIVFGRSFYEGWDIRFHEASNTTPSKRWVLSAEVDRICVQWDGKIWADSDMVPVYVNPYLITHYLLSRGFDLFSLISQGLAIDSKTLQPQQQ